VEEKGNIQTEIKQKLFRVRGELFFLKMAITNQDWFAR